MYVRARAHVNLQAWEAYEAKILINLVDPKLEKNFPEEEAVRFLKVGLLCAQENLRLRPMMSAVVRMLTSETDLQDVQISEPGKVSDFNNIRTRQTPLSEEGSSTSSGTSILWSSANLGR